MIQQGSGASVPISATEVQLPAPPPPARTIFSDAIWLAAITAAAYWIAFTFEAAYLQHFAVPWQLVRVGADLVLVAAATIVSGLFGFFGLANMVAMYWPKHPAPQANLARICVVVLLAGWVVKYNGFKRDIVWVCVTGSIALLFLEAIHRENFRKLRVVLGRLYPLACLTAFGTALAIIAGNGEANNQEEFFVVELQPGLAVVRMYPDLVICARYDAASHTIEPGLQFRRFSDDHPLSLIRRSIGPLRLKPLQRP